MIGEMIKCAACGQELPAGSVFCNKCGTKRPAETVCAACGQKLPAGSAFCNICGTRAYAPEAANAQAPWQSPVSQPPPSIQPQYAAPPVPSSQPGQYAAPNQEKPMSKNMKLGIGAVAGVVALVIILAAALGGGPDRDIDSDLGPYSTGGSRGAGGAGNTGNANGGGGNQGARGIEQALASGDAVQYQRVTCYDKELGCEAVRSIAPEGWTSGGEVYWMMQCGAAPATIDFYIISPDNSARAGYISSMGFVEPDPSYNLKEGDWSSSSLATVKAYQRAETFAQNFFVDFANVSGLQLVDVRYPEGDGMKGIQDYLSFLYQQTDAILAQGAEIAAAQNATYSFDHYADGAEVTVRFNLNGTPCKAKILVVIFATEFKSSQYIDYYGQVSYRSLNWNTAPLGFNYYMAEESRFDEYEAAGSMFFSNRIINGQWNEAIMKASDELFKQQLEWTYERLKEQYKELQRIGAQYVAQSAPKYSYSSGGSGGSSGGSSSYDTTVIGGWHNVVTGYSYYEGPDGGHVRLEYKDYHYSDGSSIVSSPEPLDTVGTNWYLLPDLGPMGGRD